MIWLLDGNLLTALVIRSHEHHDRAMAWFYAQPRRFATCPVTEGTLLRLHMIFAAAIHLGATHFLTFDDRQRTLAQHAGLVVPV